MWAIAIRAACACALSALLLRSACAAGLGPGSSIIGPAAAPAEPVIGPTLLSGGRLGPGPGPGPVRAYRMQSAANRCVSSREEGSVSLTMDYDEYYYYCSSNTSTRVTRHAAAAY